MSKENKNYYYILVFLTQRIYQAYNFIFIAECQNAPVCENAGFVAHNCRCMCPADLTGVTCNQVSTDTGK